MSISRHSSRSHDPSSGAYVVGISGGSASGKSTLAAALADRLASVQPVVLNQDAYFRDWSALPPAEREARMTANHPEAVLWAELVAHVARLRLGVAVRTPVPGTQPCAMTPVVVATPPVTFTCVVTMTSAPAKVPAGVLKVQPVEAFRSVSKSSLTSYVTAEAVDATKSATKDARAAVRFIS